MTGCLGPSRPLARLREAESRHSEGQLALSRADEERLRLRRQVSEDFGLVEMEPMDDQPDQPPLPLNELVSTLPVVAASRRGWRRICSSCAGRSGGWGP